MASTGEARRIAAARELLRAGDARAARRMLERSLERSPGSAFAWGMLGEALEKLDERKGAEAAYRRALELAPDWVPALYNLGRLALRAERLEEAAERFRAVCRLDPAHRKATVDLAIVTLQAGAREAALALLEQAIARDPGNALAHVNLCRVYLRERSFDRAAELAQRGVRAAPREALLRTTLAQALFGQGRLWPALKHLARARRLAPQASLESQWLFALSHAPSVGAERLAAAHGEYDRKYVAPLATRAPRAPLRVPLRVGYVSPDLHRHSMAFFLLPVLRAHDRSRVEAWCYSSAGRPDEKTGEMRAAAAGWRDCAGWSEERIARQVREDRIDVLVDLAGHTAGNALGVFARRPAPAQVQWFGYPPASPPGAMDARLTDAYLDPPGAPGPGGAENLVRLPARECFDPQLEMPVNALPALEAGGVTFGSLNEPAKLNDRVLDCWARVLAAVPRSRLLVGKADSALFVRRVRERLARDGIAGGRVEPVATLGLRDYVALHHRIDVLLDPFPYNGGTITCFALWMGVPVVSLTGPYGAARMGHALLSHVGLPDLAAASEAQYVARCAEIAGDLGALARLRRSLRARFHDSPLGRAQVVVGAAEAAFSALRETR